MTTLQWEIMFWHGSATQWASAKISLSLTSDCKTHYDLWISITMTLYHERLGCGNFCDVVRLHNRVYSLLENPLQPRLGKLPLYIVKRRKTPLCTLHITLLIVCCTLHHALQHAMPGLASLNWAPLRSISWLPLNMSHTKLFVFSKHSVCVSTQSFK